jgi:leader peptidase (prepilin peptidase) / N-methyltransferase
VLNAVWITLVGACLGSFANVIIYRLPRNLSIVKPGSHCTECKKSIPWYLNIPILSCLFLRARCAYCKTYFGWRHLLVEALMAGLFLLVYQKFGFSFSALEAYIFVFGLVTITFIDFDFRIIPDTFSLSGIVIGLIGAYFNPDRSFTSALYGVIAGGGIFWSVSYLYYVIRKEIGLGGGDIKLLAWIGAVLGLQSIIVTVLVSSVVGTVFGLFIMIKEKGNLKTSIPYGPFLSLAALIYLFWGVEFTRLFYSFFFPWLETGT